MMKKICYFAIIMACLVSCNENGQVVPEAEDATSSKVETGDVFNITSSTAIITGSTKIDLSDYQDVAFGVMYSDREQELSSRKGVRNEAPYLNGEVFEVEIRGLKPQTTYYYCAWLLLNGKQYEYGDIKSFNTISLLEDPTKENGHSYVDLGLSVKWATTNMGADNPEEYGDYIASSHRDIAKETWGGAWRLPTMSEFEELVEHCTWSWTMQNRVNGYKITSNIEGYTDRNIFLPAAGHMDNDGTIDDESEEPWYWTKESWGSYQMCFYLYANGEHYGWASPDKCPARPVCP